MHLQPPETGWSNRHAPITLAELSRISGISADDLDELVDYGALVPVAAAQPERLFGTACIVPLRRACRMRLDFDLDLFTVALMLDYVNRIALLESQLQAVRAHLPARVMASLRSGPTGIM